MLDSLLKSKGLTVMHHKVPERQTSDLRTYGLGISVKANVLEQKTRNAQRVTYQARAFLVGKWGLGERELTCLDDLSTTGCCVISESPLHVGSEWTLSLVASWSEPDVTVEVAKVQWAAGNRYGLEFLAIDPVERERLRLFLKVLMTPPVLNAGEV